MGRTADYVLDLLESILGPATCREAKFPWACGDRSPKTGKTVLLPFDAYWEHRQLIVEVDEDQHSKSTPFFDHVGEVTVSGVDRGIQRKLYDQRKRQAARANGFTLLEIPWSRRKKSNRDADMESLRELLINARVRVDH